jgi:flagellar biosynthesis/type III secretory pathway protein FliH
MLIKEERKKGKDREKKGGRKEGWKEGRKGGRKEGRKEKQKGGRKGERKDMPEFIKSFDNNLFAGDDIENTTTSQTVKMK